MSLLQKEIDANFERFFTDWTLQAPKNWKALKSKKHYLQSYRRLCCIGAIKRELVIPEASPESAAFFLEAHNDALTSHVMANVGAWRASLQALRSCLENSLCCLYYKDHPVELRLWTSGKFRIGFSELHKYFLSHPELTGVPVADSGLNQLKMEYGILSKAVHGSTTNFRMTDNVADILLWSATPKKVGQWATQERRVLEGISLLMVHIFRRRLQGTKLPHVRQLLSFAISKHRWKKVRDIAKITIQKP